MASCVVGSRTVTLLLCNPYRRDLDPAVEEPTRIGRLMYMRT